MSRFWETSPEWQRKEELHAELDKATNAKADAGQMVLASLRMGFLDTESGRQDRAEYLAAHEVYQDAYVAWATARKAFEVSPAGQAKARYFARLLGDPIGRASSSTVAEVA